jgi:signal transduction histidine kinase
MKLEEIRPGVFAATLTAHELSVLMAGARMSLSLMETDPDGTTEQARSALEAVLASFDSALARVRAGAEGRRDLTD